MARSDFVGIQVAFQRVMIVRDLFTGGKRSFASIADARAFRQQIYLVHGLPLPGSGWSHVPPRVRHEHCSEKK
jgi:hypothetical protein